jgi:hypothetical protein
VSLSSIRQQKFQSDMCMQGLVAPDAPAASSDDDDTDDQIAHRYFYRKSLIQACMPMDVEDDT